jgi:hypothetical protein
MSKTIRKSRPIKFGFALKKENSKFEIRNSKLVFVVIAILVAIPFVMGKFFEFNQPDPFDGGGYAYSAWHILNGAKIGVDEKPSAQLGTLMVNILGVALTGFNETGAKLVQTILQITALILMFIALRRAFGTLSAAVGVIITSAYLSAPLIAKFGNVKEQYMIAFMVMGISCFVLYQLGGRWWYAVLTGAFLSWAPLFKQTGVSAIGAIGLFVILQPIFRRRTLKQTGLDILLLLAGVVIAIAPLYIWILAWNVQIALPYSFVWQTLGKFIPSHPAPGQAHVVSDYIGEHRKLIPFSQQWPVVLRYYLLLILPIALATGAVIARLVRMIWRAVSAKKKEAKVYDRFVLLFAVWWILDMAFVWISPASYEQYYLPLNASAAMTGGYLISLYCDKIKKAVFKTKWMVIGAIGLLLMVILSWHIFFGIRTSPHTAAIYRNPSTGKPERQRGYLQRFREISGKPVYLWETISEYIHTHSQPTDKIYVWGWYPGIYVMAQRLSAASEACSMPRPAPLVLSQLVATLLDEFKRQMPKFIVDSRKRHVPTERPPYELWPIVLQGFMSPDKSHFVRPDEVEAYDKAWSKFLRERFDEDEALRYEALKPFREFVMKNYRIVNLFGEHVLFELKSPTAGKESQ